MSKLKKEIEQLNKKFDTLHEMVSVLSDSTIKFRERLEELEKEENPKAKSGTVIITKAVENVDGSVTTIYEDVSKGEDDE